MKSFIIIAASPALTLAFAPLKPKQVKAEAAIPTAISLSQKQQSSTVQTSAEIRW